MSDVTLWWLALGLGLVVLIVAVSLLRMFVTQLRKIERQAEAIWQTGKELAANTATTWQLQQTAEHLHALAQEALKHGDVLRGDAPTPDHPASGANGGRGKEK